MNKTELFEILHTQLTGSADKKDSQLLRYEKMDPKKAVAEAQKYLKRSQKGQDECQSDFSYWGYEGDITRAKIYIAVFKALAAGLEEFPPIDDLRGHMLMIKVDALQTWAEKLEASL